VNAILLALGPVALILGLGQALRLGQFLPSDGWRAIEKLVYYVMFPALLGRLLWQADIFGASNGGFPILTAGAVVLAAQAIMGLTARASLGRAGIDSPAMTSLFQSNVRFNSFTTLIIAESLYGSEGLARTALAVALLVPVGNTLSVILLARHGTRTNGQKAPNIAREIITHPLIMSCIAGLTLNALQIEPPRLLDITLEVVSRATLPLGILVAGAGLDLASLRRAGTLVFGWSTLRLLLYPALIIAGCWLAGITGIDRAALVLCGAAPTATAGFILARQMGGNAPLMASLITTTTLMALLTMPLILWGIGG